MSENRHEEPNLWLSQNAGLMQLPEPSMGAALLLGGTQSGRLGDKREKFHKSASRLYLAIVNRAILDALENGKNSPAAQRWLLSRDFDKLEALFR